MAIYFIILKELFKSPILVINFKRLLNIIKEWDTTWIPCDSLYAWLSNQSRLIAKVFTLIARQCVGSPTE